jgi:hypothetical protein
MKLRYNLLTRPLLVLLAAVMFALPGCMALQQIAALRLVRFDLDRVAGVHLVGIPMERFQTMDQLSPVDLARIAQAIGQRRAPAQFVVHVQAQNPADNPVAARMVRLDWTLMLEGQDTISGVYNDDRVIQPGATTTIPLSMELDLVQFFGTNLQDIVQLGLALAGQGNESREVALRIRPTINTAMGPITYPGEFTVIRQQVGGR